MLGHLFDSLSLARYGRISSESNYEFNDDFKLDIRGQSEKSIGDSQ